LARLQTLAAATEQWAERIDQVKRMHSWVVEAEHILDGSWATAEDVVNNERVGHRFDQWRTDLTKHLSDGTLSEVQQKCLQELLQILSNVRPYLIQCYDHQTFPRTNNDTEREIRAIKTRYRRISGRKNWNSYLLRYGRCVAFYEWWEHEPDRCSQLEHHLRRVTPEHWKELRQQTTGAQREQLKRFRFRCKRTTYLSSLEIRWEAAAQSALLP
jgi:Transposase IS66 family